MTVLSAFFLEYQQKGNRKMNELIRIDYSNDQPAVSARDLHEFLEVGTKYADWFPRMCEYGFTEGQDFNLLKIERVRQVCIGGLYERDHEHRWYRVL